MKGLKEMVIKYQAAKADWIKKNGNDQGFDEWFTVQTLAV